MEHVQELLGVAKQQFKIVALSQRDCSDLQTASKAVETCMNITNTSVKQYIKLSKQKTLEEHIIKIEDEEDDSLPEMVTPGLFCLFLILGNCLQQFVNFYRIIV